MNTNMYEQLALRPYTVPSGKEGRVGFGNKIVIVVGAGDVVHLTCSSSMSGEGLGLNSAAHSSSKAKGLSLICQENALRMLYAAKASPAPLHQLLALGKKSSSGGSSSSNSSSSNSSDSSSKSSSSGCNNSSSGSSSGSNTLHA